MEKLGTLSGIRDRYCEKCGDKLLVKPIISSKKHDMETGKGYYQVERVCPKQDPQKTHSQHIIVSKDNTNIFYWCPIEEFSIEETKQPIVQNNDKLYIKTGLYGLYIGAVCSLIASIVVPIPIMITIIIVSGLSCIFMNNLNNKLLK